MTFSVDPKHILAQLSSMTNNISGERANSRGIIIDPAAKSVLSFHFKRPDGTPFVVTVKCLTEEEYDLIAKEIGVEEKT